MMIARLKDPGSALTHFIGALLSLFGLFVLVHDALAHGTVWHVVSFTVFGVSLILLYSASTLYHALNLSDRKALTLRKLDHMMIFVLIAGTYTPFCLLPLRGVWGWSLFGAIWGCALLGIAVKLVWMTAPRWLYTGFYVLMGWLVIVAVYPLSHTTPVSSLYWMVAGGLSYTIGALFYALKWPNPWPGKFGFHEVWHLFVLGGSLAHFAAVLCLLGPKPI